MHKLLKWKRKKVVVVEDSRSSVGEASTMNSPSSSPRPKDYIPNDSEAMQASFFHSANNVGVQGGQFNNVRGNHTNLVINFNKGGETKTIPSETGSQTTDHLNLASSGKDYHLIEADNINIHLLDGTVEGLGNGRVSVIAPPLPPIQKSSDIYFRHISVKEFGYPLWIPEPNNKLPIQYQRQGIDIGDVGIITPSGSFDFLFNIRLPAENPINPSELPDGFSPLYPPLHPIDTRGHLEFKPNSYLTSSSVHRSHHGDVETSTGLTFESSASEGAILAMPDGAYSIDLANIAQFRRYMAANAENWYKYANGIRGREALNGDLRLVIGCHKSTSWGMATFSDIRERKEFRLRFKPTGLNSVGLRTYGWETTGIAEVRAGPDPLETEELRADNPSGDSTDLFRNQCLFLRTLNVALRSDIWDKLMAELEAEFDVTIDGPEEGQSMPSLGTSSTTASNPGTHMSDGTDGSKSCNTSHKNALAKTISKDPPAVISGIARVLSAHPSEMINQMLLAEHPEARMAITEDWDWMSVLTEDENTLPPASEMCNRIRVQHSTIFDKELGAVFLRNEIERPLHNPSDVAASIISSDSKTLMTSRAPSPRSATIFSSTSLEGSSKSDYSEYFDSDDREIRSLGLNPSGRASVIGQAPSRTAAKAQRVIVRIAGDTSIDKPPPYQFPEPSIAPDIVEDPPRKYIHPNAKAKRRGFGKMMSIWK